MQENWRRLNKIEALNEDTLSTLQSFLLPWKKNGPQSKEWFGATTLQVQAINWNSLGNSFIARSAKISQSYWDSLLSTALKDDQSFARYRSTRRRVSYIKKWQKMKNNSWINNVRGSAPLSVSQSFSFGAQNSPSHFLVVLDSTEKSAVNESEGIVWRKLQGTDKAVRLLGRPFQHQIVVLVYGNRNAVYFHVLECRERGISGQAHYTYFCTPFIWVAWQPRSSYISCYIYLYKNWAYLPWCIKRLIDSIHDTMTKYTQFTNYILFLEHSHNYCAFMLLHCNISYELR